MKVLHNSCNIVTCTLPDMSTLSPRASGVHIRQSTCACVTTITYMHSPSGTVCPRASCVYIRQSTLACVITYTYTGKKVGFVLAVHM